MAAPPDNSGSSLLFDLSPIEEDDAEWRQAFAKLQEAFVDKSEVDIQNWLQINVSKDTASYNETINGLLYTILVATSTTLPANHANNNYDNPGTTAFRRIGLVTRDGLTFIVRQLRYFCHLPSFHKIRTPVREQTIWLVGQLAEARVQGTEVLFTSLLRQIRGGDISPPNIQLADSMLRLLEEQIQFVYSFPHLIAYSCYTFLRLMLDHARVTGLRQREAAFCGRLLRERFRECCEVGRDLIRAMQDVARIKEIEEIWVDLLHAPERLNPQLEGIHQIMATPSNPFYLTGRLTPDMEQKLSHILKHLNHGQHYWNLNKFVERFLSAPETDALFCDVIRYICGVYHPSNQVLASSIVPRFVLINDLFRSVKSNIAAANIKLALFYDWLFYDPARDNIMNIEPAALLLHDSVVPSRAIHHRQPHMTAILIEFLQFTVDNYHPPMREYLQQHVGMAGQDIVDKGVIKALSHEHYAPIREHLVALFHPTLGNMGESIPTPVSGGAPGSTGVEAGSADLLDGTDEFETPNSYLDTPPDGIKDDEEEVMMGGSVPRASSETPPPGMDVGDSPRQPSEHDEDMEDEEEDEIMESSAGPTSSLPSTATTSAKVVLDPAASSLLSDWTAGPSSPITATGVITSGRDDNQPEDKPRSRQSSFAGPSASLWLFGSLPQDFKAAFEEDPKSEKSVDMFRRIWEVFGDEAGAGVDGAELAKEIGREVRAFAAQAVVPETFCSTKHRHHTPLQPLPHRGKGSGVTMDVVLEQQESQDLGPLEGLISCLWKITRREGPSGALRVARLFLQADSQEEYADRQLSMWFLIGILHGYLRSIGSGVVASGDGDVSVAGVLDVYRTLLGEEAAAMAEQQQQPKSEADMELDVAESKSGNSSSINNGPEQQPQEWMQSSLLRDLSLIQDRQLGVFDRVLPLVLEHLSDIVPRTLPFFKLVLALNVPSQLYSLSLGLVRKRFTLFARGLPSSKERQAMLYKDSLANGHTEQTGLHVGGVAPQPPSSAEQELSPSTSPSDSLLPSPALLESFKDTLNWETYEQVALWQLFVSEFGGQAIVATRVLRTSWVSRLTFATQAEALGGVLNMQHSLSATSPPLQLQLAVLRVAGQQQQQQQQQQYQQLSHTVQEKDNQVSQDVMDLCASAVEHWGRKHPEALQAALLHLCRGELAVHAAKEEEQAMHVNSYSNNATTTTSTGKGKKGKKTSSSNSAAAARALDPSSIWQDNLSSSVDEYGLLKTALVLILSWWKSISVILNASLRENEETIFFEFWDSQIQSAVSNRLKECQGPMELDHWPAAWWETRRSSSSAAAATDKKKKKHSDESRVTKSNTRRSRGISVSDSEMDEKEDDEDEERENGSGAEEGDEEDGDDDNDNEDDDDEEDEENDDGGNSGRSNKRSAVTWASSRKTDQTKKKVPERGSAASSPRVRSSPRNQSARTMEGPKAGTSGVSQTKGRGSKGSAASSPSSSRSSTNPKSSPVATTRSSRSRNAAASSRSTRSKRRNQSEDESEGEEEEDEDEEEEGDDDEEGEGEDNDMEEDEKEPAAGSGEDDEEEEEEDDKEGRGEDEEEEEEGSEEEEDVKPARGKGSTTASRNAKGRTPPQRRRLTKASSATRASNSRTTQASRRKTNKNRKGGRGKKDEESDYQQSASDDSEEDDEEGEAEEEEEEEREQESRSEDDDDDDDNTSADNRKDKSKGKSRVVNKKKNKRNQDSDAMDEDDPEEKDEVDQQSQDDDEEEEAEGNSGSEVENDKEEEDDDQGEEEEGEDDDEEETNSRTTRTSGAAGSRSAIAQRKGSTTTSRRATRAISSSPEAQPAKRRGKHKRRISDDEDDESS
ncbi:Integrator complex subunit 3 [Actinomortierella wolfii]|nr:Integrator complex subunit 3 [Actinomortierella wolfii]